MNDTENAVKGQCISTGNNNYAKKHKTFLLSYKTWLIKTEGKNILFAEMFYAHRSRSTQHESNNEKYYVSDTGW
jgi:hypothetical protein